MPSHHLWWLDKPLIILCEGHSWWWLYHSMHFSTMLNYSCLCPLYNRLQRTHQNNHMVAIYLPLALHTYKHDYIQVYASSVSSEQCHTGHMHELGSLACQATPSFFQCCTWEKWEGLVGEITGMMYMYPHRETLIASGWVKGHQASEHYRSQQVRGKTLTLPTECGMILVNKALLE